MNKTDFILFAEYLIWCKYPLLTKVKDKVINVSSVLRYWMSNWIDVYQEYKCWIEYKLDKYSERNIFTQLSWMLCTFWTLENKVITVYKEYMKAKNEWAGIIYNKRLNLLLWITILYVFRDRHWRNFLTGEKIKDE